MLIVVTRAGAPAVAAEVPADFHQVPLDPDTEDRTAAQLQVLADMQLTDRGQREALSLYLEALAIRLASGPVSGTAFCAVQIDGVPSTATLTVAVHQTHTLDRGLAVLGAAEAMRRESRFSSVEIIDLGLHPAVVAVTERPSLPADSPSGEVGQTLRELSVLVPVVGHDVAALITVSTPCLEHWQVYRKVALDVARSVR